MKERKKRTDSSLDQNPSVDIQMKIKENRKKVILNEKDLVSALSPEGRGKAEKYENDERDTPPIKKLSEKKIDKLVRAPLKLKESYLESVRSMAADREMTQSAFIRKAIFAAMRDPTILDSVDDMEREYLQGLGSSRWHSAPD